MMQRFPDSPVGQDDRRAWEKSIALERDKNALPRAKEGEIGSADPRARRVRFLARIARSTNHYYPRGS